MLDRTALRSLRTDVGWLLPVAVVASVPALAACLLVGPAILPIFMNLSGTVLMLVGTVAVGRTARLPGLPGSDRRLWRCVAATLCCYCLGMIGDLAVAAAHEVLGTPAVPLAIPYIYPVAGLLSIVAMFQYPTTARTIGERVTVGMDINIVLLSGGVFIWYFSLSSHWDPSQGPVALFGTLVQPLLSLVAGFAMLRTVFAGAGVISRPTLLCFAAGILISAGSVGLASMAGDRDYAVFAFGAIVAEFMVALGCLLQYRISVRGRVSRPARSGRRQVLTFLPFAASAAAFLLLVIVLSPLLDWRRWGVLGGIGLLLAAVSVRQALSLRENRRLLSRNDQLTAQLQRQAWFDELTGLANRAHYGNTLRDALSRDTRTALLLIDLDDFKNVNDSLGHAAGDTLLREVAGRLTNHVRGTDTVCRLGGDEFVVIAEDSTVERVNALADRLVQALTEPVRIGEQTVRVGASIGVALAYGSGTDPGELLREADVAMYAAKAAGKAGWRFADRADQPDLRGSSLDTQLSAMASAASSSSMTDGPSQPTRARHSAMANRTSAAGQP